MALDLNQFQLNSVSVTLISLSVMFTAGFILTRLTKMLSLPNVTGYIIAGIIVGPYFLNIITQELADKMSFIGDIALSFIAFDVGKFLTKKVFKETGYQIILITLFESLIPGIMIALTMNYVFHLGWKFSLLLGAIAIATAPASTIMTINQYKASGNFVNSLIQIVALDDVVSLLVFSIITVFFNVDGNTNSFIAAAIPILYNILALVIGFLCGILLSKLLTEKRSYENRLILTITILLGISGLCSIFDISPLLACMLFGSTYISITDDKELYSQMNNFTPPILALFFILSGTKLDINSLSTLGLIGVVYFIIRIVGKYIGAFLGCEFVKAEKNIRNYLGVALIPQAGVSIGLAFLAQRILPVEIGNMLLSIILSSSVLYELIGPISAKYALIKSGAIKLDE